MSTFKALSRAYYRLVISAILGLAVPLGCMSNLPPEMGSGRMQVTGGMSANIAVPGRPYFYINYNWDRDLFLQGIQTPNATVFIVEDINMDLSGLDSLHIAPGVHILGGRSATVPGPRLFTNTRPARLFLIGYYLDTDNVRISGIRLDGRNMGIADSDAPGSTAISVYSSLNIEIANCEIYGWQGSGISVNDERNRLNLENASGVWIHDNYIHHNRHWRTSGYGVVTGSSAYALIERNVFDYNRHAIASSGDAGTGYLAYHNLLLTGGGENFDYYLGTQYTHEFDVHGSYSDGWGRDYYAGPAGQYFDYRYNTLWYNRTTNIKVRGYPSIRAEATENVFRNGSGSDSHEQTDGSNFVVWNNRYNQGVFMNESDWCDFNGDGVADELKMTGATWWMRSSAGYWSFLNTSTRRINDTIFYDYNADGRCDVYDMVGNTIYSGGRGSKVLNGNAVVSAKRTDLVWQAGAGGNGSARLLQINNATIQGDTMVYAPTTSSQYLGTGDFNADGASDILWRDIYGQVSVTLLNGNSTAIAPIGSRSAIKGTMALTTQLGGIADFNGDGRADILWRHADGTLEMWFAGEMKNSARPGWYNYAGGPVEAAWKIRAVADFNGDGYADILWRHDNGQVSYWYMQGSVFIGYANSGGVDAGHEWEIQAVGDFDSDGYADILWRHVGGGLAIWFRGLMEYSQAYPTYWNQPGANAGLEWQIQTAGDFNGDGRADIMWRHTNGYVAIWYMSGGTFTGDWGFNNVNTAWQFNGQLPLAPQRINLQ